MLSRIAESLYWIGRYVERAEDTARITDVNFHHTLEMGSSSNARARRERHWEALITIVGDSPAFFARHAEASEETVPPYLTFDTNYPNSIISCIAAARENARTMRHQLASEMWEVLNRFHLDLQRWGQGEAASVGQDNAHNFYRWIIEFSHLFQGLTDSTMPREEGWHFLQAGKFLERAEKTARALDVKYHLLVADTAPNAPVIGPGFTAAAAALPVAGGVPGDWHQWLAMLRSLSAYEAYHKIYRSAVRPRDVIEMLMLSPAFPRSIRFALGEVDAALARIAASYGEPGPGSFAGGETERAIGRLCSTLKYQRVEEIFDANLHTYLLDLQTQCYQIGELIQEQYFDPRLMRAEEIA